MDINLNNMNLTITLTWRTLGLLQHCPTLQGNVNICLQDYLVGWATEDIEDSPRKSTSAKILNKVHFQPKFPVSSVCVCFHPAFKTKYKPELFGQILSKQMWAREGWSLLSQRMLPVLTRVSTAPLQNTVTLLYLVLAWILSMEPPVVKTLKLLVIEVLIFVEQVSC